MDLNKSIFSSCFQTGEIQWRCFEHPLSNSTTNLALPQQRHSHSCAIIEHKLYIFGGLSATSTSYNDLWALDLTTKRWHRPTCTGKFPSPKAAATLLGREKANQAELLLYGGYSHPFSYPINQQVNFFEEFHVFCAKRNVWDLVYFTEDSPKLAGHSASLIGNQMILFGGCNSTLSNKSNSVYCLGWGFN